MIICINAPGFCQFCWLYFKYKMDQFDMDNVKHFVIYKCDTRCLNPLMLTKWNNLNSNFASEGNMARKC